MLTVIVLSLMTGQAQGSAFAWQVFAQLFFGAAFGVGIALVSQIFLRRFRFASEGFDAIFMVAVALAAYAAPTLLGGQRLSQRLPHRNSPGQPAPAQQTGPGELL